jgi:hypothetical protein
MPHAAAAGIRTHRRDTACGEVGEPRVHERGVVRRSRRRAAVAHPQLGVGERVELLALDDPRIERHRRGIHPSAHPVEAVLAVPVLPVAEQLRDRPARAPRRRR